MRKLFSFSLMLLLAGSLMAQQSEEYLKVINNRADGIVKTLNITDEALAASTQKLIAKQYIDLGVINDNKELSATDRDVQLRARHYYFIANLEATLTPEQIEKVKDGMTMGVYPKTLQAHYDMIPSLTEEEKAYIRAALKEAREYAMDCSDSQAKHAWFGKYKGRINNYLAARGYDLKKEREGWYQRIEAEKNK